MKKLIFIVVTVVLISLFFWLRPWNYHLSEAKINQFLTQLSEKDKFHREFDLSDLASAKIQLSDIVVAVGRREPNRVQFDAKASIKVNSPFGNTEAELTFSVDAIPYFDAKNKAIYVKSLEIIDASTQSNSVNRLMPVIRPILQEMLSSYFNEHAVYQLDPNRSFKERIAYRYGTGINVIPGNIIISFMD